MPSIFFLQCMHKWFVLLHIFPQDSFKIKLQSPAFIWLCFWSFGNAREGLVSQNFETSILSSSIVSENDFLGNLYTYSLHVSWAVLIQDIYHNSGCFVSSVWVSLNRSPHTASSFWETPECFNGLLVKAFTFNLLWKCRLVEQEESLTCNAMRFISGIESSFNGVGYVASCGSRVKEKRSRESRRKSQRKWYLVEALGNESVFVIYQRNGYLDYISTPVEISLGVFLKNLTPVCFLLSHKTSVEPSCLHWLFNN